MNLANNLDEIENLRRDLISYLGNELKIEYIPEGKVSNSYKISNSKHSLHCKLPKSKIYPSFYKLKLLNKVITGKNGPRIINLIRKTNNFENGIILSGWIEGFNIKYLLANKKISLNEYLEKISLSFIELHKYKFSFFSDIDFENSKKFVNYSDYISYKIDQSIDVVSNQLTSYQLNILKNTKNNLLNSLGKSFSESPSIIHRDASRSNVIINSNKAFFVDWDNAEISSWISDIGRVIYLGNSSEERKIRKEILLKNTKYNYKSNNDNIDSGINLELLRNHLEFLRHDIGIMEGKKRRQMLLDFINEIKK